MRLWVSDLQSWQRYRGNEDVTLEDCLKQLRRQEKPSPILLAGRKLHKALEIARVQDITDNEFGQSVLKFEDYLFFFHCDADVAVPGIRELKGEMPIETRFGTVLLVGVVDSIGCALSDYKLTGHFDAERLASSYQWRCYLEMFGLHRFDYKVFVGQEIKPQEWAIGSYHELSFYRYPDMLQEIKLEVEGCVAFMREYVWT